MYTDPTPTIGVHPPALADVCARYSAVDAHPAGMGSASTTKSLMREGLTGHSGPPLG